MKNKHDFKAALDELNNPNSALSYGLSYSEGTRKTIQLALRIAERLQSGEVSDDMAMAGQCVPITPDSWVADFQTAGVASEDIYKTMSAQLIKESENE